jgi:hypothetical protein
LIETSSLSDLDTGDSISIVIPSQSETDQDSLTVSADRTAVAQKNSRSTGFAASIPLPATVSPCDSAGIDSADYPASASFAISAGVPPSDQFIESDRLGDSKVGAAFTVLFPSQGELGSDFVCESSHISEVARENSKSTGFAPSYRFGRTISPRPTTAPLSDGLWSSASFSVTTAPSNSAPFVGSIPFVVSGIETATDASFPSQAGAGSGSLKITPAPEATQPPPESAEFPASNSFARTVSDTGSALSLSDPVIFSCSIGQSSLLTESALRVWSISLGVSRTADDSSELRNSEMCDKSPELNLSTFLKENGDANGSAPSFLASRQSRSLSIATTRAPWPAASSSVSQSNSSPPIPTIHRTWLPEGQTPTQSPELTADGDTDSGLVPGIPSGRPPNNSGLALTGEAEGGVGNGGSTASSIILPALLGAFGLLLLIAFLLLLLWHRQAKETTEKEAVYDTETEFGEEMTTNDSIDSNDQSMNSLLNPETASEFGEFEAFEGFDEFGDLGEGADEIF